MFNNIRVDADAAILEEQAEGRPAAEAVAEGLGEIALAGQTRQLELGPGPERFDLGQAVGLPRGAADIGGLARDVALDVVERADPVQRLARDL